MLPILGPTTARDARATVDFFQPTTYVPRASRLRYASIHEGSAGRALRDARGAAGPCPEMSSVDLRGAVQRVLLWIGFAAIEARRTAGRAPPSSSYGRSLAPSGGKVIDPVAQHGGQGREAAAPEH
jgi:hypothetical protein